MKIKNTVITISAVLAIIIGIGILTHVTKLSISESTEQLPLTSTIETSKVEEIKDPSPYADYINLFELRDQEIDQYFNNPGINVSVDRCWNNTEIPTETLYAIFDSELNTQIYFKVMKSNYWGHSAITAIGFENADRDQLTEYLSEVDFTQYYNEITGYISTWDSYIIVNNSHEFNYDTYEFINLNSIAYVLGIDIQESLANMTFFDMLDMQAKLEGCIYWGIRGYDEYLKINPDGVIIDNYQDLYDTMENPDNSPMADVFNKVEEESVDPSQSFDYAKSV